MPFYNICKTRREQRIVAQLALFGAFLFAGSACAQIRNALPFRENARNPAWSSDGQILFERSGQIFLAGATMRTDRALTHGQNHSPEWHPLGRFFAYASTDRILFMNPATLAVLDSFPAVDASDLRFSRDGSQLAWRESGVAHVRTGSAISILKLPVDLTLIGIDDFGITGRDLLITAHAASSRDSRQAEIYSCSIVHTTCRALTSKSTQRQDFARLCPSGRQLLFASSETAWVPGASIDYESDLWLQPLDLPALAKRMTWFNEPANPRYNELHARVTSGSWSNDGRWLLITVTEGPRQDQSHIEKIEFPEPE